MTLVSALSGCEGVVLFADTQETVTNYSKKTIDKITVWDYPNRPFRFAISGACDDASYSDMLQNELSNALLSLNAFDLKKITDKLGDTLAEFYAKHIWPRGGDRPQLQYLIALQPLPLGSPQVIQIAETAVNVAGTTTHTQSIGVGRYLADYLFGLILGGAETISHLCAAAVFVAKEAYDNIDGVGDIDRIVIFDRNGGYDELSLIDIKAIQENLLGLREASTHLFSIAADLSPYYSDDIKQSVIAIAEEARERQEQWLIEWKSRSSGRANAIEIINTRFIKRIS